MGAKVCMNALCGDGSAREWKLGWTLRSGGFAQLCNRCGSAYENSVFCDKFHHEEPGWRECKYCNKPIHCGCIISRSLFEHLDFGGICCVTCVKAFQLHLIPDTKNPNGSATSTKNNASDRRASHGRLTVDSADDGKLMQLCRVVEATESSCWPQAMRDNIVLCSGPNSQEVKCPLGEEDTRFSNLIKPSTHSLPFTKLENNRPIWETNSVHESPELSMSLEAPSGSSGLPSVTEVVDRRLEGKASSPFHQGKRSRPTLPKQLKTGLTMNLETNKDMISQTRTGRPPAEGRGKNQLLPRYWPRITDQELEQLSGDLKSTVVPLFEKVLSASDAGRIGRLVLPKACAEAYFPPISQSEGVPLQIQDMKGNEWAFQFRFWPNNNSRMYVLEGVTPCIQSMQLNAGDTVTFSRIDPGGKLVMGFRRASNSIDTQDASTSSHSNGTSTKGISSANENMNSGSSHPNHLQLGKENSEPHSNGHSEHVPKRTGAAGLLQTENCEEMINNDPLQRLISVSEKKRTRNIGPKSKRLLIHSKDAMELRLTWEDAHDLLRPPPSVKPSIVTIEDQVIEEYDEPPVFGKRTTFNACSSGGKEQWVQCDDCSKWRRLPGNVLLPPKWTCSENVWDASRSSCSASEEPGPKELENLLKTSKGFKKRKIVEKRKSTPEQESSGLDALASVAVLGDNLVNPAESSTGVTTKHPRHRPGCTCIVCIQPPSGKGRHKPTCTCLACMTVKRRFKTLMMRKKKRQLEREAEAAQKDHIHPKEELDTNGASADDTSHLEKEGSLNKGQLVVSELSAGQIDLNCHPQP